MIISATSATIISSSNILCVTALLIFASNILDIKGKGNSDVSGCTLLKGGTPLISKLYCFAIFSIFVPLLIFSFISFAFKSAFSYLDLFIKVFLTSDSASSKLMIFGGNIIAVGKPEDVKKNKQSITGAYLSKKLIIESKLKSNICIPKRFITVKGAKGNNLKSLDVKFPLNKFISVTGVSGGGKSSLVIETLYKSLAKIINKSKENPLEHDEISGSSFIDKVIKIDQSPIGRTPRSNPATYTGSFTFIRDWFSQLPESRVRGYKPGRFSFNVKGGRCENCKGDGVIRIEMHFLADMYVNCDQCGGNRFNRETLEVKFRGKNISDILNLTVDEALIFFKAIPSISSKLKTLNQVGLDYIKVGQSATTLSGGEAQRIKLSRELSKRATGNTLYILDEPTTGLHTHDVKKLLEVLHKLVEKGNTVVVIEHNLDVIKTSDWIIDLGPKGGVGGGELLFEGNLQQFIKLKTNSTAKFLRKII